MSNRKAIPTFAHFETLTNLNNIPIRISHQSSLPLSDLTTLSNGTGDSTGMKVWLCSKFILALLSHEPSSHLLHKVFHGNTIFEIGCGAGAVGIALLLNNKQFLLPNPAHYYFSDNDLTTVHLVEHNCVQNSLPSNLVNYALLDVNDPSSSLPDPTVVDVILAIDVIYDKSIVRPLFSTAMKLIQEARSSKSWCGVKTHFFVLCWCVRMNLNEKRMIATEEECGDFIKDEAKLANFNLVRMTILKGGGDLDQAFVDAGCNCYVFEI